MSGATNVPVGVVEDHDGYRESLEVLLHATAGFELAGSFASGEEFLDQMTGSEAPSLAAVLMDLGLPGLSGLEVTRRIRAARPEVLVIVVSVREDAAAILEAICAGADGYLTKAASPADIVQGLRVALAGGGSLTPSVARRLMDVVRHRVPRSPVHGALELSKRQKAVLALLVEGNSYKQVAHAMGISVDTVRTHVRGLYRRLQVHNVAEAVTKALRFGLV